MSEQTGYELVADNPRLDVVTLGSEASKAVNPLLAKVDAHPAMRGLAGLSIARQIGLMLGIALSVAIGVAIVVWSQESSYSRLYAEIGEKDVAEIIEVLNTQAIKYKVEAGSNAI
ncbi:MAG: flagellar M-ring protein FliF, partial [Methylococcaceae bacterium]|nr:flagellar M-ring protein FliF [Methylococcaceae bacterium]